MQRHPDRRGKHSLVGSGGKGPRNDRSMRDLLSIP